MNLRERFAAWLCFPLQKELDELKTRVTVMEGKSADIYNFCNQLSADMAKQTELRSVMETQPQPRLRTARNWNEFVSAATLASRKRS